MRTGTKLRHYKGGKYIVLNLAKHTETEEDMIVYQSMETGLIWVRPLSMFDEEVAPGVKRFVDLDEPREWVQGNPVPIDFNDKGELINRSNDWKRPRKIFLGSTALRTTRH